MGVKTLYSNDISSNLFKLEKYTINSLNSFNIKHGTQLSHKFAYNTKCPDTAGCELNAQDSEIIILLPQNRLDRIVEPYNFDAFCILVGHELAHVLYANMNFNALQTFRAVVNSSSPNMVYSCCIEVAADLHGKRQFIESGGNFNKEVANTYSSLLSLRKESKTIESEIAECLLCGYPTPQIRERLLIDYDSFSKSNYTIVDYITHYLQIDGAKVGKKLSLSRFDGEVKDKLRRLDFPNKLNKKLIIQ